MSPGHSPVPVQLDTWPLGHLQLSQTNDLSRSFACCKPANPCVPAQAAPSARTPRHLPSSPGRRAARDQLRREVTQCPAPRLRPAPTAPQITSRKSTSKSVSQSPRFHCGLRDYCSLQGEEGIYPPGRCGQARRGGLCAAPGSLHFCGHLLSAPESLDPAAPMGQFGPHMVSHRLLFLLSLPCAAPLAGPFPPTRGAPQPRVHPAPALPPSPPLLSVAVTPASPSPLW